MGLKNPELAESYWFPLMGPVGAHQDLVSNRPETT